MMNYGHIYRIKNTLNDRAYIGSTTQKDPYMRWCQHRSDAKNRDMRMPIHRAIKKYGDSNFEFEVIAVCPDRKTMNTMERAFISLFNTHCKENGYNVQVGGDHSGKHSETTKKLISKARKERNKFYEKPVDQYDRTGVLIARHKSVLEAKRAIGVNNGSVSRCCQGKNKTVHGYVFRYAGEDFNKYSIVSSTAPKPVLQIDKNTGKILRKFDSARAAAAHVGVIQNSNILGVCHGKKCYKTAHGYKWRFA